MTNRDEKAFNLLLESGPPELLDELKNRQLLLLGNVACLTTYELTDLSAISKGLTRAQAAENREVGVETVKTNLVSAKRKLGAWTTPQAVALVIDAQAIPLEFIPSRQPLTPRQEQIARLIALGLGGTEIARHLQLSHHTFRNQSKSMKERLDARNKVHLVTRGYQARFLP